MKFLNTYIAFTITLIISLTISCGSDDQLNASITHLGALVTNSDFDQGNIVAFAGNDSKDMLLTNIYFYPTKNSKDYRFYETESIEDDYKNLDNYTLATDQNTSSSFNGYIQRFSSINPEERWIIVTYSIGNNLKLSDPIRIKNIKQPTKFNADIEYAYRNNGRAKFTWQDDVFGKNDIYFQVVSDVVNDNDLLSGTFTKENAFTYYDTLNVVNNITEDIPVPLILNRAYNITLMDISADNWVNGVSQKSFIYE